MSNFISTYTIDFNDMKLMTEDSHFCKSSIWDEIIMENNGSFSNTGQYMAFDCHGLKVEVDFDFVVSGRHEWDPGDWYTEPTSYCDIDNVDIDITAIYIDEYKTDLTPEIVNILKKIIDKNL